MSKRALELVQTLGLEPHPEGGHFKEVYRSAVRVRRDDSERAALTTIFFLLQAGEYSRWHVVASDEAWHFYEGDALELLAFDPRSGKFSRSLLGSRSDSNAHVQVVPAGHWQAARPCGEYSLVGCTVAPGFEFSDFGFVAELAGHQEAFNTVLAAYRSLL